MHHQLPTEGEAALLPLFASPPGSPSRQRRSGVTTSLRSVVHDINMAAVTAGVTTFLWTIFGALTLQLAVLAEMGVGGVRASSWIVVTWLTSGLVTLTVSLRYRQPIPVGWSMPALVYLGAVAPRYSFAELAAANLVAGLIITTLALLGVGERLMRWIPLPIVMGVFAASVLSYLTRLVEVTVADGFVGGATVAGYLAGKALGRPRVPAMALAVLSGGVAVVAADRFAGAALTWQAPALSVPAMAFSPTAVLAVSLPLAVLTLGFGNIEGLGFLIAQGYRVPLRRVSLLVGLASLLNALFGGHPAAVARVSAAMVGGDDAGPKASRYVGAVLLGLLFLSVALAAPLVTSLVAALTRTYVVALAGLGILAAFQAALEKAFGSTLRFGAVIAFAVAATSFTLAGIPPACWAILAGCGASYIGEREQLLAHWRGARPVAEPAPPAVSAEVPARAAA